MEDENKLIDPLYWQRAALNDNAYNVTEAELQALIETFERELSSRNIDEDDEERRINALAIQSALNGFRAMLQQIHQNESTYQQIVDSGIYYSFYFKDDNHRDEEPGDICLILDGEKTGHIIPFETLSDLQDSISMFIYSPDPEDTEKYEPLRAIVGSRPFLPVPWYINLCVLNDQELPDVQMLPDVVTDLMNYTPQKTEKIIATIDKISSSITEGKIVPNAAKMTKVTMGKGHNYAAKVAISFDPDALKGLSTSGKINAYDMEILRAVSSIYQAGNSMITPGMIANFLAGKKVTLNDSQRIHIENSMKKLMGTTISIDVSGEANYYNFDGELRYEEPMVFAGIATVSIKGNQMKAYNIKSMPILTAYASQKKQIITLPVKLLDTPVSKNEDMSVLHGLLSTRIQIMKKNKNMGNRINYDNAFDHVYGYKMEEYTEATLKKKRSLFIDYIHKILTEWVKQGFISAFEEYKDGRKKAGVAIMWDAPKKEKKGSRK